MGPFYRFFGGPPLWVIIRLIVLSVLGIDPIELWYMARNLAYDIWYMGFDALGDVGGYLVVGAIIVVPIWLILRLLKLGSGRS